MNKGKENGGEVLENIREFNLIQNQNLNDLGVGRIFEVLQEFHGRIGRFKQFKFTVGRVTSAIALYRTGWDNRGIVNLLKRGVIKPVGNFDESDVIYTDAIIDELKKREQTEAKKESEKTIKNVKEILKEDTKEAIGVIVNSILENHNILTFSDTDEIFVYEKGVYRGNGSKKISKIVQSFLQTECTIHIVNEVVGHIKRSTYTDRENVAEPITKICLQNGILNLDTLEVEPHSPDVIFFNKLPVNFNKEADCPRIKNFLSEVVPGDSIPTLQEMVGYCLYKNYFVHKAFMLVGDGANGKSTFINLIKRFLGFENCASEPLQSLETNRFAQSSLFGKLANVFADLPARALRETSCFKMLTGQDPLAAERKFKDRFSFVNYAKLIFSCNQIPRSPDNSDAFFRRWLIIIFPHQFLGNDADKKLAEKLTTPAELSGFLNFAIEGLRRLLQSGEFSNSSSIEQVREDYIRKSDSVASFNMDCVLIAPDEFIEKRKLYTEYTDYCRDRNYPVVPENTFHKELQAIIRVEDYHATVDNKRVRCWRGIKIDTKTLNGKKGVQPVQPVRDVHPVHDVQAKSHLKFNQVTPSFEKTSISEKNETLSDDFLDSKQVKDTLFSLFAMQPEIEIQQFLTRYPEKFHTSIEILLDNLKRDGEIFEPRPGWIKML
jgi:putative DNA primase/helicase